MAVSDALGERRTVRLPAGVLEYRERGRGAPLVFVHGAAVNPHLHTGGQPGGARRTFAQRSVEA